VVPEDDANAMQIAWSNFGFEPVTYQIRDFSMKNGRWEVGDGYSGDTNQVWEASTPDKILKALD
jgi:hypothetical protein